MHGILLVSSLVLVIKLPVFSNVFTHNQKTHFIHLFVFIILSRAFFNINYR